MSSNSAYHHRAFRDVLDYFHANNIPVNLVYKDGREKVVYILNYDEYNIICEDLNTGNSLTVFKHTLKRIETQIKLDGVIEL